MLAGFYVVALGVIAALGWLSYWLFDVGWGGLGGKLFIVTIGVAIALVAALWKVATAKTPPPEGVPLAPEEATELFHTVAGLARGVGTRAPDEIRLIPDVNAAVSEDTRLFGLLSGRRYLYLGLPLVQAFTVAQLRAVLAHELGHYSESHTRVGAIAHRGRMTIVQTVRQVGDSFAGIVFSLYARAYVLVEQSVSRRMEYEADAAAVRLAGREPAMAALRDLPAIAAAWGFFVDAYMGPGLSTGYAPQDVFGGFRELLSGRAGELQRLRDEAPPDEGSRWDSHPPIGDRIRAMAAMADPGLPADPRPAVTLLPAVDHLAARVQMGALPLGDKTLLPWAELTAAANLAVQGRYRR